MAFKHGIYIYEEPTSILPPVQVNSALPIAFVTAPVHLANDPYDVTNKPVLCFTNREAVSAFGFNMRPEIWDNYTAPQVIFSQFALFGVAPLVLVNVLDPKVHNTRVSSESITLDGFSAVIPADGILIDTVSVAGYEIDTHYTLSFNRDGLVVISAMRNVTGGIAENARLTIAYTKLAPEKVDIYDVIGGYNNITGRNEGLELVEEIFPRFRLVPGQILAPGFSSDSVVAAVMETRGGNINGHFRCIALCDMPTMLEDEQGELVEHRFTNVPAWKNLNNYISTRQYNLYPMLRLGSQKYYYSTQMAGLIGRVDADNRGVPYNSPSNKNLRINGLCYANGEEVVLNVQQANFLNGQGITAAINFVNGWVAWGNRTGAFPGNTDPKDSFINIRRMFDWIGNTIVLSNWRKIAFPLTRRSIDTIVDSVNIWLNGLTAQEFILGGRIEFLPEENQKTDFLNGNLRFRLMIAPPPPIEAADFILEFDPAYLQTLFGN